MILGEPVFRVSSSGLSGSEEGPREASSTSLEPQLLEQLKQKDHFGLEVRGKLGQHRDPIPKTNTQGAYKIA